MLTTGELDVKTQIEVLNRTIWRLENCHFMGCCGQMEEAIIDLKLNVCSDIDEVVGDSDLRILIPSFNKENALRLARERNFKEPKIDDWYWWKEGNDKDVRIKFLTELINDLKNK